MASFKMGMIEIIGCVVGHPQLFHHPGPEAVLLKVRPGTPRQSVAFGAGEHGREVLHHAGFGIHTGKRSRPV
jgi:hypothetical protein